MRQHVRAAHQAPTPRDSTVGRGGPDLRLHHDDTDERAALERTLLAFDVADDLASLVPMPGTIPLPIRAAITRSIAYRFESMEELNHWLREPNLALSGDVPFDCLIAGDGLPVLLALDAIGQPERRIESPRGARDLTPRVIHLVR